jgi:hypothetical protein
MIALLTVTIALFAVTIDSGFKRIIDPAVGGIALFAISLPAGNARDGTVVAGRTAC